MGENIFLNGQIKKQNRTIYHLQHPCKWQWCDYCGHIWKDFKNDLSKQIDEKYLNDDENNETKANNSDCLEMNAMHKMVYYSKESIGEYFIQRVSVKFKNNSFMNPTIWKGPARQTFGDRVMTLYHVTDGYAADIIKKTRTMKCGKIGRFGGGIYFAEKVTTAQGRVHHKGYVITARVLVGKEYIIKENDSGQIDGTLNFKKLHNKQCDSVYAIKWTERVVYHSDQVCILDIK